MPPGFQSLTTEITEPVSELCVEFFSRTDDAEKTLAGCGKKFAISSQARPTAGAKLLSPGRARSRRQAFRLAT